MKALETWFRNHRKAAAGCMFVFFVLMAGSSFPFYNLTKPYPTALTASILMVNAAVYGYLGAFLTRLRPNAGFGQVFLIQLGVILGGMLARFLLEFGEVSNTYNFTAPNIALHLAVTLCIGSVSWWWTRRKHE